MSSTTCTQRTRCPRGRSAGPGSAPGWATPTPNPNASGSAPRSSAWTGSTPSSWRDVLDAPPLRLMVNGLFYCGRRWALSRAAVIAAAGRARHVHPLIARLVGLETVTGERYVLLDLGYEAIDLLHDTPREVIR